MSSHREAKKVAKKMYGKQFGVDSFEGSITQMRGIEGSLMKKVYQNEARKYKIKSWYRNTKGEDSVNIGLNIANSLLYGLAASCVGALSMSPALGVIHRGNAKAFLFDLADLYKAKVVIPLAFSLHDVAPEDVPKEMRRALRREIHRRGIMKDLFNFVIETFGEYTPENNEDRLIGTGDSGEVLGHVNYGDEKDAGLPSDDDEENIPSKEEPVLPQ